LGIWNDKACEASLLLERNAIAPGLGWEYVEDMKGFTAARQRGLAPSNQLE
jgi:hypothetical protein